MCAIAPADRIEETAGHGELGQAWKRDVDDAVFADESLRYGEQAGVRSARFSPRMVEAGSVEAAVLPPNLERKRRRYGGSRCCRTSANAIFVFVPHDATLNG